MPSTSEKPGGRATAGPRSQRGTRLIALVAIVQILAAGLVVTLVDRPADGSSPAAARARVAPTAVPATDPAQIERDARTAQVRALLAARSKAVLGRDRAGFLATVDPAAGALRSRQAAAFDALAQVPLQSWTYTLDPEVQRPDDGLLDARYGKGQWWAPEVTFGYTLTDFDRRAVTSAQHLTFVRRDGRWLLGADDDFAADGGKTPRQLWDNGPVIAVRSDGVLALGHPASIGLLKDVAATTAVAIPAVSAVWGTSWSRRAVVIVPATGKELDDLLGSDLDLSQIAAVATAELASGDDYDPAGDRILVNPSNFPKLGPLGRRVVLRHELTHVASRAATGPDLPAWLAEGLADYVGYQQVSVPLSVSARELRADVQAGKLPRALPVDSDFDGGNPRLAQAYEQSWLAVRLLVAQYGQAGMLKLYREVGGGRGGSADAALETALSSRGSSTAAFTKAWRADLQRKLG